jgi:hypothetical protein
VYGHRSGLQHAHDTYNLCQSVLLQLDHHNGELVHRHGAVLRLAHDTQRLLRPVWVQLVERNHVMCGRAHTVHAADHSVELRNAARLQLVYDRVPVHGNHHGVQSADPSHLPYPTRLRIPVAG